MVCILGEIVIYVPFCACCIYAERWKRYLWTSGKVGDCEILRAEILAGNMMVEFNIRHFLSRGASRPNNPFILTPYIQHNISNCVRRKDYLKYVIALDDHLLRN